jgi:acyl-CoA hydrolase
MEYKTRKLIRPEDLNSRGNRFGGTILKWIDEEAAFMRCVS